VQTNYAREMFLVFDNFNIASKKKKKNSNSLLTRNKSSYTNNSNTDVTSQPIYKIARYKNAIKQKRMEFLNNGNTTT
jgi:hypothetical protein